MGYVGYVQPAQKKKNVTRVYFTGQNPIVSLCDTAILCSLSILQGILPVVSLGFSDILRSQQEYSSVMCPVC